MGQFVSQDDYCKLVNVCVVECSKDPPVSKNLANGSVMCLLCVLCYVKQQENAKAKLVGENVAATGVEGATFVAIHTRAYSIDGGWFDHRGTQLFVSSRGGMSPGGPPLGYNLVFTTKAPLAWPPQHVAPAPVQESMVAPATVGNTGSANFCAFCGKQREGNGKFCTGCGAAVG